MVQRNTCSESLTLSSSTAPDQIQSSVGKWPTCWGEANHTKASQAQKKKKEEKKNPKENRTAELARTPCLHCSFCWFVNTRRTLKQLPTTSLVIQRWSFFPLSSLGCFAVLYLESYPVFLVFFLSAALGCRAVDAGHLPTFPDGSQLNRYTETGHIPFHVGM